VGVDSVTEALERLRVVPVVVLEHAAHAAALGEALNVGGYLTSGADS
jgi:hypothetical protein